MVVVPNITERTFYIIIAVIAVIGLIVILIQIRRVRKASKKVNYLDTELKLKKMELVKGDMESVCLKNKKIQKPAASSTFKLSSYRKFLGDVDESIRSREFTKIESLLNQLDAHEKEFDRKKHKFEMDDEDYKRKISKYDWEC